MEAWRRALWFDESPFEPCHPNNDHNDHLWAFSGSEVPAGIAKPALARIGASDSCGKPVSSDRSGNDRARVNTGPTGCESWSEFVKLADPLNF